MGALRLKDGDRVAVVGGGPAGALFAHFALAAARQAGIRLGITLFEGKAFGSGGARGCNRSAGVIARDFADELAYAGIPFPETVVQRRIDGYFFETPSGSVHVQAPREGDRTVTVFRGGPPSGEDRVAAASFDAHLLAFVASHGVAVVAENVEKVELNGVSGGHLSIHWHQAGEARSLTVALVVVATGVESPLVRSLAGLGFGYSPPKTTSSIQAELALGREEIDRTLGNSIGAYMLPLEGVQFAALTPKARHVTATLIGDGADARRLDEFLSHPAVRRRLGGVDLARSVECACRPKAVVGAARNPFADRLVVVGDAAVSRLFKNGLQSALVTARAAARTAIECGVEAEAFARHYAPVCRAIARDNRWGRMLFDFSRLSVAGGGPVARRLLAAVEAERQHCAPENRPVSELLWDTLSGTRPYADIVRHLLRAGLYVHLVRGTKGVA